jgi:hypothetical protein
MVKKTWSYIKVSLTLSPLWFILNIIILIIFRLAQLGTDFGLKYATEAILDAQKTGNRNINIVVPFVLFFLMMTIGAFL